MKYLNLGCGSNYSKEKEWTNLDFVSSDKNVISHNLLNGIPFPDEHFDLVYHSHVLEHFTKEDGEAFVAECFRVLKKGGVLRIAVPCLETIARNYLHFLELGIKDPENAEIKNKYEWTLIEMFDQTVRNFPGGSMGNYLKQQNMPVEDFIYERTGEEAKAYRKQFFSVNQNTNASQTPGIASRLKSYLKNSGLKLLRINQAAHQIGNFRLSGEIHQWMYDRYSLYLLLKNNSATQVETKTAFSSYVSDWQKYELDGKNNVVRKPDSLFIEAVK